MPARLMVVLISVMACGGGEPPPVIDGAYSVAIDTYSVQQGWLVNYPKQHKLFAVGERLWLFHSDGVDGVYRTSTDGRVWSAPQVAIPGAHFGHRFGGWYDGSHFHFASCTALTGDDVLYRRASPTSDGQLNWSAEPQTVYEVPADRNVLYPKVITDEVGHPWVSFTLFQGGDHTPPTDAIVVRSDALDGSWQTSPGTPHTVVAGNSDGWAEAVGVPLDGQRVFWIANHNHPNEIVGHWYDGMWTSDKISDDGPYALLSGANVGGQLHIIAMGDSIEHRVGAGDSWQRREITGRSGNSGHTGATVTDTGLVVAWLDTDDGAIVARALVGEIWQQPFTVLRGPVSNPENGINLAALQRASATWDLFFATSIEETPGQHSLTVAGVAR